MTRRQKRREPYVIEIDNLSHEGRGVGRHNGKTVFVRGALPSETVNARTIKRRGRFDEAICLDVITPSSARIEPACAHAEVCGGCSLQHLSADDQIAHKHDVLFELLKHQGGLEPSERLEALRGPAFGYRRKARLGVKYVEKKGGALVGFREKAAPYIADIQSCPVLDPSIGERLLELRALIDSLSIRQRIPQLEVAVGDDSRALVVRHLEDLNHEDLAKLAEFQRETEIGIYLQPGNEDTIHALDEETPSLSYQVAGVSIDFEPSDFTQVNAAINTAMVERVTSFLELSADDTVLDLFCGLGNFTLALASHAGRVRGVEGSEALVERASLNANRNGLTNVSFSAADLADETAIKSIDTADVDKVLLDPPRTGADVLLANLDLSNVSHLVYVSCNPVTLARDSKHLVEHHGFQLARAGVMDMFPQTAHVESIAVFLRT